MKYNVSAVKSIGESIYIAGMKAYVYGYPMVVMDVTRDVLTAAPAPHPEGRVAPINQFANTTQ